jgi:membrane protein YdbS with pleckstrin-like domain
MTDEPQSPQPDLHKTAGGEPNPDDFDPKNERDLWAGRVSWKTLYPLLLLWLLIALVISIAPPLIWPEDWSYALLIGLGVSAALLIIILLRGAYRVFSQSYRITTQRLFIRRGILSQTVNQTELLRVDDVQLRQTLLDRMLNIGTVEIVSSDRTDANLVMAGLDNPAAVAEHIRRNTRMAQRSRTLFMEQL